MRTPEQIRQQLEARMAELERESQKPERVYPCTTCRHVEGHGIEYQNIRKCHHPLVKGLDVTAPYVDGYRVEQLCGPEKALWEPKRNIFQWLRDWFLAPWRDGHQ